MTSTSVSFPGRVSNPLKSLVNSVMFASSDLPKKLSARERLKLVQSLNRLVTGQFEELLVAINPPAGVVSSDTAAQGSCTSELLRWAECLGGCGLSELQELLSELTGDPR